jgi:uncharacterized membrane protein
MIAFQLPAIALIGSLFALTGLRQFFLQPLASPFSNTLWFLLQVAPLLLALPGVLRATARGFFGAVLAAMLYFIHGVLEAATPQLRVFAWWEIGFATTLVVLGALAMRRLHREAL